MSVRLQVLFAVALCTLLCGCGNNSGVAPGPRPTPTPVPEACLTTIPPVNNDPQKPVITLKGARVVDQPVGTSYVDQGATANDPQDGDITSQLTVAGLDGISTDHPADYLIRYNVRNSRGSVADETVRVVRVTDGTYTRQSKRGLGTTSSVLGYFEHLPVNYSDDPAETFPLIIHNHGIGEAPDFPQADVDPYAFSPDYLDRLLRRGLSGILDHGTWDDSRPFIVLSPQRCVMGNSDDRERSFVDYAVATYKVDPTRIYMTGFSMGAGNTWNYVLRNPDQLAAAITISGGGNSSSQAGCTMKNTPTWSFHAADDRTVPVNDTINTVLSIRACNPTVPHKLTIYPTGGHLIDIETLELTTLGQGDPGYDLYDPDLYTWLLQFSRAHN